MAPRSRLTFIALFIAGTFIIALFSASPARAATPANHCVAQLSPVQAGQTTSDIQSYTCYATLSESIFAATRGRVNLPDNASKEVISQMVQTYELSNAVQPQAPNIIAIFNADINFGGASLTWQTTGPSCTTGATYGMSSMPKGWNDVVSSVLGGYYGCRWYHLWIDSNYSSGGYCYTGSTSNVGFIMNDLTSSVYVRTYDDC